MEISVIGFGNMGAGIAKRAASHGHNVSVYLRTPSAEKPADKITFYKLGEDFDGEIVIMALPYESQLEVAKAFAKQLSGKIVVDISNPIDWQTFKLKTPAGKSAAEQIAELAPGTRIIKAFNMIFSGTLALEKVGGSEIDLVFAGDDMGSKEIFGGFIKSLGMRPLDGGELANARALEAFELVQILLQKQLGGNMMSAVKFVA